MIAIALTPDPVHPGLPRISCTLLWTHLRMRLFTETRTRPIAISPVGTAESSPGRSPGYGFSIAISPEGTTENDPGRQSWVNSTTRECYGNHPRPTRFSLRPPIAYNPRTTCTPKQICSLIWTALAEN